MPQNDVLSRLDAVLGEETELAPEQEIADEEVQESEERLGEESEKPEVVSKEVDEEEVEEREIASLSDLAEHLGVDVADLYNVTLPVTAGDGTKKEVSLGEWKDAYQDREHLLAERRKFETRMGEVQQEIARKAQGLDGAYIQADQMIKAAEKQLIGEIDGPEMIQLRANNPAEYAAKKQEYRDRLTELQGMRQQAVMGYQQQMQENQRKLEMQRQEFLQSQAAMLPQIIPEWKDERRRQAESAELSEYLISAGFPKEQVESVDNASMVAIARKAMLWDKQQKSKPEVKKKILSIGGKVLKSGKAPTKTDRRVDERNQAKAKIRKASPRDSEKAAQAYIEKYLLD